MAQADDFLTRLSSELQRSLGDALGLFRQGEIQTAELVADLIIKLSVSLILVAVFWLGYYLLRAGAMLIFKRLGVHLDIRKPLLAALRYIVIVLSVLVILSQFGVAQTILSSIAGAAIIGFIFYIVWLVSETLLSSVLRGYGLDRSLEQLLRNIVTVVVAVFAFSMILAQFGVDVLAALAGLGIAGIALGFAAQETLANFIAGITLLAERPFRIGDWIEVSGLTGKVQEISLRTTRLITRDNIVVIIPNGQVAASEIKDFSGGGPLRIGIPIGIAYKDSASAARKILLAVAQAHPKVMKERSPSVLMRSLGASSVDLELLYWLESHDIDAQPRISAAILEGCKEALDEAGIEMPFPHLQLFIDEARGLEPVLKPFHTRKAS